MRIAIAQINTTVGDFDGNVDRILDAARRAAALRSDLVVTPELSICGYPPMDLLDHDTFVADNLRAIRRLQRASGDVPAIVVGMVGRAPAGVGRPLQNLAVVVHDGQIIFRQAKRLLPTYDVFDEARYFEPGARSATFTWRGERVGIAICEDIWWEQEPIPGARYPIDPVADLLDLGATVIVAPSASPFHRGKASLRERLAGSIGRSSGTPVVYANLVGGNDSLVFDGGSFATDADGAVALRLAPFEEALQAVDVTDLRGAAAGTPRAADPTSPPGSDIESIRRAVVLGVRDYLRKTGFSRVHFGLSGGIDSAVVAAIAVDAVGPDNVHAFLLPSRYSSPGSITDSHELAQNLGIRATELPIAAGVAAVEETLADLFAGGEPGLAEENIQARMRGLLLMAYSNRSGSLVLTTGNKSELAVGYCTLYGDMAGGLGPIGDLLKTEVYALARHYNREREVIPRAIIEKAPSAELRPDQRDQDSLPPYDLLDRILSRYIIDNETASQIIAAGYDRETVTFVLRLVARSEYKRRQAPPVIKLSPRAFGTGRRMPIARVVYEAHE